MFYLCNFSLSLPCKCLGSFQLRHLMFTEALHKAAKDIILVNKIGSIYGGIHENLKQSIKNHKYFRDSGKVLHCNFSFNQEYGDKNRYQQNLSYMKYITDNLVRLINPFLIAIYIKDKKLCRITRGHISIQQSAQNLALSATENKTISC